MYTITAYNKVNIIKNHMLFNLSDYLAKHVFNIFPNNQSTFEVSAIREVDTLKPNFKIKVEKSSTTVYNIGLLNYLSITNPTGTTYYYFVTDTTQISDYIYELTLELDVVNSFNKYIKSGTLTNAKVKRRMKDRLVKNASASNTCYRIFDKVDEGLGTVATELKSGYNNDILIGTTVYVGYQKLAVDDNTKDYSSRVYPHIYTNDSASTKYSYYYCNTNALTPLPGSGTETAGNYKLVYCQYMNKLIHMNFNNKDYFADAFLFYSFGRYVAGGAILYYSRMLPLKRINLNQFTVLDYVDITSTTVGTYSFKVWCNDDNMYVSTGKSGGRLYETSDSFTLTDVEGSSPSKLTASKTTATGYLPAVSSVSNSDSNILKMRAFVGSPDKLAFYLGNEIYISSSDYIEATASVYLANDLVVSKDTTAIRNKTYESKLYGSYVRTRFLNYDTFKLPYQVELLVNQYANSVKATISQPLDMTDNALISVSGFSSKDIFDNYAICSRNNDQTVFTDSYLSYIQTGYNYDVKSQQLANFKNGLTAVTQAAASFSTLRSKINGSLFQAIQGDTSIVSGGSGISNMFGFNYATQAVSTSINSIVSNVENTQSLESKKLQSLATIPTVSGNNNFLLFKKYSGNNLQQHILEPTAEVEEGIYNLFYFFGYADNTTVAQFKPSKTREYFDYYQIDADNITGISVPNTIKNLILQAYSQGITIEYNYNDTWLTEGTLYENWETSL